MAFSIGELAHGAANGRTVITGSRGRGQSIDGDVPVSSGIIGRMAADGYGPPVPFATVDEAAQAGLEVAASLSTRVVFGGAVIEAGGGFYATSPVTINSPNHIRFSLDPGVTPVGIFHTHPGSAVHGRLFSENDVVTSQGLRVPSYIGVLGDRSIRVFDPSTMRPSFQGRHLNRTSSTTGREVCSRCF